MIKRFYLNWILILLLFFNAVFIFRNDASPDRENERTPSLIDTLEFNWRSFWIEFKSYVRWDLEYYALEWISRKDLLTVVRKYPQENKCKISLNFTSDEAGDYRLTFAIEKAILGYIDKSSDFQYNLTYEGFSLVWDWSDLKEISGLIITHGVKNGFFWFRIRRDDIPEGKNVILDPVTIATSQSKLATAYESGAKTFRNPRGLQYFYAMAYNGNTLNFYKASTNFEWVIEKEIFDIDFWEGGGLWVHDDGSVLWVCFIWINDMNVDDQCVLYFRKGYIEDDSSSIILQATIYLLVAPEGWIKDPSICMDSNNRIWVVYSMRENPNLWNLVCKISKNPLDEDPPSFTSYYTIHNAISSGLQNWADIAPFSSSPTPNVLVVFIYRDFRLDMWMAGRECQYEKKKFTLHILSQYKPPGLQTTDHPSLVIDSSDEGHIISQTATHDQYHRDWIEGSGWGDLDVIITKYCLSRTLTMDENDTLYAFYTGSGSSPWEDNLYYKNSTDGGETWGNEIIIPDGLGVRLDYLSVCYERIAGSLQIVYTTEYPYRIRFWSDAIVEIPEEINIAILFVGILFTGCLCSFILIVAMERRK